MKYIKPIVSIIDLSQDVIRTSGYENELPKVPLSFEKNGGLDSF